MRLLEYIWKDIKRGENIDLYATVLVSFFLVFLGLLGVASENLITSLTLAVLGLLAISTLGNRYRTDVLIEKLTQVPENLFLEEYPPSLKNDFANAEELFLVGVHLYNTIGGQYSEIKKKLHKGDKLKVILVHPDGEAPKMASGRSYARPDVNRTCRQIEDSLQLLCDLKRDYPDKVDIRTIQFPISFGAIAIDPNSNTGVLYLEHYPFRTPEGSKPKFVLRAKDMRWYNHFVEEINLLWESSVEWKCEGTLSEYAY